MAKKPSGSERSYIDREKTRRQRDAEVRLTHLLEYNDEQEFIKAVKEWRDVTADELKDLVMLFRACQREKRGLGPER